MVVRDGGRWMKLVMHGAAREKVATVLPAAGGSTAGPQVITTLQEPWVAGFGHLGEPPSASQRLSDALESGAGDRAPEVLDAVVACVDGIPRWSAAPPSAPDENVTQALMLPASMSWRSSRLVMSAVRRRRVLMRSLSAWRISVETVRPGSRYSSGTWSS